MYLLDTFPTNSTIIERTRLPDVIDKSWCSNCCPMMRWVHAPPNHAKSLSNSQATNVSMLGPTTVVTKTRMYLFRSKGFKMKQMIIVDAERAIVIVPMGNVVTPSRNIPTRTTNGTE